MRKKHSYRVCRCTPEGCVVHLEARLLHDLVNREIHPIRCAESCRRKAQVALRLGDLCEEAGHPWWALKVWMMACQLIANRDYDEWIGVWFNTDWVRLSHVVAEEWCLDLGRRIDGLWGRLGHPEMGWWEAKVRASYDWLWLEKYDFCPSEFDDEWDAVVQEYEAEKETEAIFQDGLGCVYPKLVFRNELS